MVIGKTITTTNTGSLRRQTISMVIECCVCVCVSRKKRRRVTMCVFFYTLICVCVCLCQSLWVVGLEGSLINSYMYNCYCRVKGCIMKRKLKYLNTKKNLIP